MIADIKYLDNPEVFRINQLPAHSDHDFFAGMKELQAGVNSLLQSLNGTWKFRYSINSAGRPEEFYREETNLEDFEEITVPCHIELAGYDKIHYVNTMYPWEGHRYLRPVFSNSFSEAAYNPVGSYVKEFDLAEGLIGKRVCIRFEGVEQAMYLWLNGEFIGYAEDSFTPSEFDLTPFIKETGNRLAVEVHKRSTAAFLEDQDFFRFFGIFRKVILYAKPDIHVEDLWLKPVLLDDNTTGSLSVELKNSFITEPGHAIATLIDSQGSICYKKTLPISESMYFEPEVIENVIPWSNGNPYLYSFTVEIYDKAGNLVEIVPYRIGFRKIEIINKVIHLNGKRLIINGVNRHEWSPEGGRCISSTEMDRDMELLLGNNINAVRTSHYPNQIPWYYLCDTKGIYLMAETNLESHGSWQKLGQVEPSWNIPGSLPQWKEVVIDRARTNFETFKNHTSILFWSLGNESYAGDNLEAMNQFYKEKDSSRLVHYEGVFHNRAYEETISDVESRMYSSPKEVRRYLEESPGKPFLLCEFMHDMGNSLGGLKSYMELLDQYDMYHGGFIWDFIDQALYQWDEITGERVLRYGGDFDDKPSDYEFSGNGIVFADRSEKPAMQEVRYYYGLYK